MECAFRRLLLGALALFAHGVGADDEEPKQEGGILVAEVRGRAAYREAPKTEGLIERKLEKRNPPVPGLAMYRSLPRPALVEIPGDEDADRKRVRQELEKMAKRLGLPEAREFEYWAKPGRLRAEARCGHHQLQLQITAMGARCITLTNLPGKGPYGASDELFLSDARALYEAVFGVPPRGKPVVAEDRTKERSISFRTRIEGVVPDWAGSVGYYFQDRDQTWMAMLWECPGKALIADMEKLVAQRPVRVDRDRAIAIAVHALDELKVPLGDRATSAVCSWKRAFFEFNVPVQENDHLRIWDHSKRTPDNLQDWACEVQFYLQDLRMAVVLLDWTTGEVLHVRTGQMSW